uniref:ANK_REP_REGION domain-containing protein n=1 Tax=Anopheles epiroticus TaxID=199890 RepID=A0A182PHL2_9DIPT
MSNGTTNDGELLCIADIFEAIASKDEQALVRTLGRSSIETMLLFETTYGISPLAHCVQTGEMSHLALVRCLLTSGLCDCEWTNDKGRTVLASLAEAHAHSNGRTGDFLERMIAIVIDGADDATACYTILKHNSLPLLEAFLSIKKYDETRLFHGLTYALAKLHTKRFLLSQAVKIWLLQTLANYGFRHLTGSESGRYNRNIDEWKSYIDVVIDCWSVIGSRYDTGSCADIDNRLLLRLQVIHNHLYFLQRTKFLDHLNLREAIFCVAVFWNILSNPPNFVAYRFIINKRLVMEFIRMIAFQLAETKRVLKKTEEELCEIVREGERLITHSKDCLIAELLDKLTESDKQTVVQQYKEKLATIGTIGSKYSSDTLIKDMIKRIRKVDLPWAETKIHELKGLGQKQREWIVVQLETRLEHVDQPQNVADRMLGELNRNKTEDTIAAAIIASESFDLEHLMRGRDRRTRRKLIKCHDRLKQLYSLKKIVKTLAHVARVNPANVESFQECLKRSVMVLGETLKNTNSTPNMPNERLMEAMERMLTPEFAQQVISLRNRYAREFSFARLMTGDLLERQIYHMLPDNTAAVRVVFNLLLVIVQAEVRRSFYGLLLQCGSLEALRSLLIFAGEEDELIQLEHDTFGQVKSYFANVEAQFVELREQPVGKTAEFEQIEAQFQVHKAIVTEVETILATEKNIDYDSLRSMCFSCDNISTIRRLLRWKIYSYRPNGVLEDIGRKWNTSTASLTRVCCKDARLSWTNPELITHKLAMITAAIDNAEGYFSMGHTRKLLQTIGVNEAAVDEEAVQQLNTKLRPYYRNMFFLDNKWKELEAFCKQRQLPWDRSLVCELRKRDHERLQCEFDVRHGKLKSILARNGIHAAEVLHVGNIIIDEDVLASIEHLQLELCEILNAVRYFGDTFDFVKQRIPIILGRSYRNLLAHDALSYNLLTDSGDCKTIVNAFVIANNAFRLFEARRNEPIELRLPTLADSYRWVDEQQQLLDSFHSDDVKRVHAMQQSGGEIKAYFCFTPNAHRFSARMVQALRQHGFDWLDSSTILHEAILQGYGEPALNTMWSSIEEQLSRFRFTPDLDRYSLHVNLLHRWKLICFVEACNMDRTSLCCAAETDDDRVIRDLLDRSCSMRKLDGVGVLGDIVFLKDGSFVHYYKTPRNVTDGGMESCCAAMINRLENFSATKQHMRSWPDLTIDVAGVSVTVALPEASLAPLDAVLTLRDSDSLQDNLQDVLHIIDALDSAQTVVCGTFSLAHRTVHFLRMGEFACAYDILPPGSRIDLSNTLNIGAGQGETVLRKIIERYFKPETVQLLVQNGANPLLADDQGYTAIFAAVATDSDVVLYLIEECLARDIRTVNGLTMLEQEERVEGNRLIHLATCCGNQAAITRLLQLGVDVTVQNAYGYTPAHCVTIVPKVNSISILKQLLHYDRTPVDMTDRDGYTLLCLAAKIGSIKLLDAIMQFKPNLTLQANRAALYKAVECHHVEWAKRFLQYAIEADVRDVTKMEDAGDDVVILSLRCTDFKLSKALLEYELGHRLEEMEAHDRPRIEAVLRASTSKIPQVPVELLLHLGGLGEEENFLMYLWNLLVKLGEHELNNRMVHLSVCEKNE